MNLTHAFPRTREAQRIRDTVAQAEGQRRLMHLSAPPGYGKGQVLDSLVGADVIRLSPAQPGAPVNAEAWRASVFVPLAERLGQEAPALAVVAEPLDDPYDAGGRILALIDALIPPQAPPPLIVIDAIEQLSTGPGLLLQLAQAWSDQRRFHLLTCSAHGWRHLAGHAPAHAVTLRPLPVPVSAFEAPVDLATTVDRADVDAWVGMRLAAARPGLRDWAALAPGNPIAVADECLKRSKGHPALFARLLESLVDSVDTPAQIPAALDQEIAVWSTDHALREHLFPDLAQPSRAPDTRLKDIAGRVDDWLKTAAENAAQQPGPAAEAAALGLWPSDQPDHPLRSVLDSDGVQAAHKALLQEIVSREEKASNELAKTPEIKALIGALREHFEASGEDDLRQTKVKGETIRESFHSGGAHVYQLEVEQVQLSAGHGAKTQDKAAKKPTPYRLSLTVYAGLTDTARKLWVSQLASLRRMANAGLPAIRGIERGGSIKLEDGRWAGFILSKEPPRRLGENLELGERLRAETDDVGTPRPARLPNAICDLADAVRMIHDQGVMHRQIDLDHVGVMEGDDGEYTLTLEGFERSMLLRAAVRAPTSAGSSQVVGTMARLFLLPEAQSESTEVTHLTLRWANADVYSFAALVAVLIAGLPAPETLDAIIQAIDTAQNAQERQEQAKKLPQLLYDLPGWTPAPGTSRHWQTYVDAVKNQVRLALGLGPERPSMRDFGQKLKYLAAEYGKARTTGEAAFAVTYSPYFMYKNIPRHLHPGELDLADPADLAKLKDRIDEWIADATEIQYAPQGFQMADAAVATNAERSKVMIVGPEVVFFASLQRDAAGRDNPRLLRLNFTVDQRSTILSPIPEARKVRWPAKVTVYSTDEIERPGAMAEIAECDKWGPVIARASRAEDDTATKAQVAVATWRFHLRLLSTYRNLREFPVNVTTRGDGKAQLVLDLLAFKNKLDTALTRMVFGDGRPGDFFASELARWREELTAGAGKLQLDSTEAKSRFDVDIHDIEDGRITVRSMRHVHRWPSKGVLRFVEESGARVAENRQRAGVDALIANPRILPRLIDGEQQAVVRIPAQPTLNDIEQALEILKSSWPIAALNGPPGTGKTTLMANLVREILDDDPAARILLTSQSHAAVDNALERIYAELAQSSAEESAPPLLRSYSVFTRQKVSENSRRNHDIAVLVKGIRDRVREDTVVEVDDPALHKRAKETLRQAAGSTTNELARRLERSAPLVAATTSAASLATEYLRNDSDKWDWVLCDEAGRAFGIEIAQPLAQAQRVVLTGDYKQLPPYRIDDIIEAIAAVKRRVAEGQTSRLTMDMLRIGDPDNVDDAVAWLVPFKRLMQLKEPFHPDIGHPIPSPLPVTQELVTQYRSLEPIGALVSDAFYDSEVKTHESRRRIPDQPGLPLAAGRYDRVLCWIDTSAEEDRLERRSGSSLSNPLEARIAAELGARVFEQLEAEVPDTLRDPRDLPEQLRVLSPYAAQVAAIRRELTVGFLAAQGRERAYGDVVRGTVGTVDSSQGAEASICIYSWVRSRNNDPIPDADAPVHVWERALLAQFGFLLARERMNVLLSRARDQMVIIGDRAHFGHFKTLWEGFDQAARQAPGESRIRADQIAFWTTILERFDPDVEGEHGRRVIPLSELDISP